MNNLHLKKSILSFAFIIFSFFGCNTSSKHFNSKTNTAIKQTIDTLVSENKIPGLNLSIIYPNGKQENYSSGYANIEEKIKLKPSHIMFSGSIGKTYVTAIIIQLIEEGKIELNKKFIDYFPNISWLNFLPNIKDITVQMLLEHTSGLPRYVLKPEVWESLKINPDKIWSYKDRLSLIFNDKPIHEAGKGWSYSDTNYILLGMLIEKITHNDYYEELKKRILGPKNLNQTFAAITRTFPNLPIGYSQFQESSEIPKKVVNNGKYDFNPQMEWTGGGIISTTSDLCKWAKIYYTEGLFSDSLQTKIVTPNNNGLHINKSFSYGMGSFIYNSKFGEIYGHEGFMPGFNSIFVYYPNHYISMALQINCDYANTKINLVDYLDKILDIILVK